MLQRYAMLLLLCAPLVTAEAQITLDQADFPLQLGSNPFVNFTTSNEDGTNTAAIDALIALSGPGQTYDFTGITFEEQTSGTITVEAGATGPAAAVEPLNQASLTAVFPFVFSEDDQTVEGTIHFYHLVTEDEAYELGSFFLGETDGMNLALLVTNEPAGRLDAVFPYAFGSMWSSMFTQTINFDGFEFSSEVDETAEVDGWGTLVVPGIEGGVPALRVKVTTEITTNGITTTDVCYEMRSSEPVVASVCEGNVMFGNPPTADFARLGQVSTAGEEGSGPMVAALDAAYPNPARDAVVLGYTVSRSGKFELVLYDVLGRPVRRVFEGTRAAGAHVETIDVSGLAPGFYLARLTVGGEQWVRSVRVVR